VHRLLVPLETGPGPRAVILPSSGTKGSVRTAPAKSRYSHQDAVGEQATVCACLDVSRLGLFRGGHPARDTTDLGTGRTAFTNDAMVAQVLGANRFFNPGQISPELPAPQCNRW
jgi:hypothetical protein